MKWEEGKSKDESFLKKLCKSIKTKTVASIFLIIKDDNFLDPFPKANLMRKKLPRIAKGW